MATAGEIEDIFTLSPAQQGMLFQILADPGAGRYFEQMLATVHGELDETAFGRAWQRVVDRHATFRTAFVWEGVKKPIQLVHRRAPLSLRLSDWRRLPVSEQQAALNRFLLDDRRRGFDLARPPLTRLAVFRLADHRYQLVWSSLHLVIDAWCVSIILREVLLFYYADLVGLRPELGPAPSYRQFVAWLKRQDFSAAERFWRRQLAGFVEPTPLGDGRQGEETAADDQDHRRVEGVLGREPSAALHRLVRRHRVTLHTLALAVWGLVLSDLSGRSDVVFGAVFSGRPPELPGIDAMVGLFINTLPVRLRIAPQRQLLDWLREVQALQLAIHEVEACPLSRIAPLSEVPRGTPLFASLLVFFNIVDTSLLTAGPLKIDGVRDLARSNFPLVARVTPAECIGVEIIYDPRRLGAARAHHLLERLQELLETIATASPGVAVGEVLAGSRQAGRRRRAEQLRQRRARAVGRLKLRRPEVVRVSDERGTNRGPASRRDA